MVMVMLLYVDQSYLESPDVFVEAELALGCNLEGYLQFDAK